MNAWMSLSCPKSFSPICPVLDPDSWVHEDMALANFVYISNRFEEMNLRRLGIELAKTLDETGNPQSLLLTGIGLQQQGDTDEGQKVIQQVIDADPQNNRAIYAMLQPWMDALARDRAPSHIVELRRSLTGPAAAVMDGMMAVAKQDWRKIAALDPYMQQSQPTDPWFVDATRLMVEWRNNLALSERRPDLADQAWQILDLAIALHPVANLYVIRVTAAYLADRPDEVLETARRMAYILENDLNVMEELRLKNQQGLLRFRQSQIEVILKAIEDMADRHDIPAISVQEVFDHYERLQDRMVKLLEK